MARKEYNALEIIEDLSGILEDDIQETALAVLTTVVQATPVGDPKLWQNPVAPAGYVGGHARRNWLVSVARAVDGTTGIEGKGSGKGAATSEAIGEGTKRIEGYDHNDRRIIIQNNVPYIVPLNNGHSTQAPVNFVQKAIQAGRNVDRNDRQEV